jgi:alkylhydroperoxidase family enzyme
MEPSLVRAVLADWRQAALSPQLKATLDFLDKLTLRPSEVGPDDAAALAAAGVTRAAAEDAIYICFLFSIMDRLADAFGFQLPGKSQLGVLARLTNLSGYRLT